MGNILIKAIRPHRQKVLTDQGEELKLQQWANKKAAEALRGAGGDTSGEQFTQAREALMRQALENPDEHGLKFMGERVPFEGQRLEEELSEPDPEGEIHLKNLKKRSRKLLTYSMSKAIFVAL